MTEAITTEIHSYYKVAITEILEKLFSDHTGTLMLVMQDMHQV